MKEGVVGKVVGVDISAPAIDDAKDGDSFLAADNDDSVGIHTEI